MSNSRSHRRRLHRPRPEVQADYFEIDLGFIDGMSDSGLAAFMRDACPICREGGEHDGP